jgi:hypothetical protein
MCAQLYACVREPHLLRAAAGARSKSRALHRHPQQGLQGLPVIRNAPAQVRIISEVKHDEA